MVSRKLPRSPPQTDKDEITRGVDATFGVSHALASLLKIDLSAKRTTSRENAEETARSEERVHTPASLLFKLRDMLAERKQLVTDTEDHRISVRQIVEFASTLRRNPVIQLMDTMIEMINLLQGLGLEIPQSQRQLQPPAQPQSLQKCKHGKQEPSETSKILGQMKAMRDSLTAGSTVDIVSDRLPNGRAAVLTLEQEFLIDPAMSNLVEGEFFVLGKVIRVVPDGESINLLRKTAMGALPDEMLATGFAQLNALSKVQGFVLPQAEWRVGGPAIHILPIAIYA